MTVPVPLSIVCLAMLWVACSVAPMTEECLGPRWAKALVLLSGFNFIASCVLSVMELALKVMGVL